MFMARSTELLLRRNRSAMLLQQRQRRLVCIYPLRHFNVDIEIYFSLRDVTATDRGSDICRMTSQRRNSKVHIGRYYPLRDVPGKERPKDIIYPLRDVAARYQPLRDATRTQLVSWCFKPSQPQRITSGLNTNFTLSPSYSFQKSSYHKSCFLSLFIFRGHSTREPASSRVTYFILQANTGKN